MNIIPEIAPSPTPTMSCPNKIYLNIIPEMGHETGFGSVLHQPISSLYTEANEAPLEERRLKLSMHYYLKTHACIEN